MAHLIMVYLRWDVRRKNTRCACERMLNSGFSAPAEAAKPLARCTFFISRAFFFSSVVPHQLIPRAPPRAPSPPNISTEWPEDETHTRIVLIDGRPDWRAK